MMPDTVSYWRCQPTHFFQLASWAHLYPDILSQVTPIGMWRNCGYHDPECCPKSHWRDAEQSLEGACEETMTEEPDTKAQLLD